MASIASDINISKFIELTQGFADTQILDLQQYGFPLDLDRHNFILNSTATNHSSAVKLPTQVDNYLGEKIKLGAILGPFEGSPVFMYGHCARTYACTTLECRQSHARHLRHRSGCARHLRS
jgi:hypothetical protein